MKTKTIILLFKIIDDALDKIVDFENLSEDELQKQIYRYNFSFTLLDNLHGIYSPFYEKNKIQYDTNEVSKNLGTFPEHLFTSYLYELHKNDERKQYKRRLKGY